ncbi:MAG TPA: hypothetical protein VIL85_23430 [Thermomicrobiales bacterium]|jgi:hypothetical protein
MHPQRQELAEMHTDFLTLLDIAPTNMEPVVTAYGQVMGSVFGAIAGLDPAWREKIRALEALRAVDPEAYDAGCDALRQAWGVS